MNIDEGSSEIDADGLTEGVKAHLSSSSQILTSFYYSLSLSLVTGIEQPALGSRRSVSRHTLRRASGERIKISCSTAADTLERRQTGRHFWRGVSAKLSGSHQ